MSLEISLLRKTYYEKLERYNKETNITAWLAYFSGTILEAQDNTRKRIEFVTEKTKALRPLLIRLTDDFVSKHRETAKFPNNEL